jgi:hypothetical protein
MTEQCRPDLIEATPSIESFETPLLGGRKGRVYVGIFAIFVRIDGRAELPTVKFNRHPSLLDMHLYLRYLVYDRQFFSLHLISSHA